MRLQGFDKKARCTAGGGLDLKDKSNCSIISDFYHFPPGQVIMIEL